MMYMKKSGNAKRRREDNRELSDGVETIVSFAGAAREELPPVEASVEVSATPVTSSDRLDNLTKRAKVANQKRSARNTKKTSDKDGGDEEEEATNDVAVAAALAEMPMDTTNDAVVPVLQAENDTDHIEFMAANVAMNSHLSDPGSIPRGRRNDVWEANYLSLVEIGNTTGNCNVALSTPVLGSWLSWQRNYRRKGTLQPDREEKLQKLVDEGKLLWNLNDADNNVWLEHFNRLVAFGDENGHCNVPQSHGDLGPWLNWQRCHKRKGKLLPERQAKLQELVDEGKLLWDLETGGVYKNDMWDSKYDKLVAYAETHGHCNIPQVVPVLGQWLNTQRHFKRKGKLLPEREAKLQRLVDEGKLLWDLDSGGAVYEFSWSNYYERLLDYGNYFGHYNVPSSHSGLGQWLNCQRIAKRRGTLLPERLAQLQALVDEGKLAWVEEPAAVSSDASEAEWNTNYDLLLEYCREHGHCNVTPSIKGLGSWLGQQRVLHRKSLLAIDKEAKLQTLVDEGKLMWDIASYDVARWSAHYADLVAFGEEHGHCNVPTARGDSRLGSWLTCQRALKKKGNLLPEREAQLQILVDQGKLMWDVRTGMKDLWMVTYQQLVAYGEANGDCNVDEDDEEHSGLAKWLQEQRFYKKKGKLTPERKELLQALVDQGKLIWNVKSANKNRWIKNFEELVKFSTEHGHCNVPQSFGSLGYWLNRQRRYRRAGTLLPEREAQLQTLVDAGKLLWEREVHTTDNITPTATDSTA